MQKYTLITAMIIYSWPLIIKDLDDNAMIQVMARENMEEWGSSAVIEHETIKAVVQAYADGKIELPAVEPKARDNQIRYAPSFKMGCAPDAGVHRKYTAESVGKYLGWMRKDSRPTDKVVHAIWALELIEQRLLSEKDFDKLRTTEAAELVKETRRMRDEAMQEQGELLQAPDEARGQVGELALLLLAQAIPRWSCSPGLPISEREQPCSILRSGTEGVVLLFAPARILAGVGPCGDQMTSPWWDFPT